MANESPVTQTKINKRKSVRILLLIAGSISLFFGIIGIFLPLLPTTPFLLLTAACYMRSSERTYNWLLKNKWFGEYIKNYHAGQGIPLKAKILAISTIWITILISMFFMVVRVSDIKAWEILVIRIILLIIATTVSIYLIKQPTYKKPT
jgi:uncharacterized membrane protein YbaN (DUF454 family)